MTRTTEQIAPETIAQLIPKLTKLTTNQPTTAELEEALLTSKATTRALVEWLASRYSAHAQVRVHGVDLVALHAIATETPDEAEEIVGNKINNRLENLELVSSSENNRHALATGLRKPTSGKGEQVGTSILTADQVQAIRAALAGGETCAAIGRAFGVHRTTIGKIKHHHNWNHIH